MCIVSPFANNSLQAPSICASARSKRLLTSQEVRAEFNRKGISISQWAVANGFPPNLVYDILADRRNPTRGQTHRIAVKLGLKEGEIIPDNELATAMNA